MSFYDRYELINLIRDEGLKTFAARQVATGQMVGVHLLAGLDATTISVILDDVRHLPPDKQGVIVETGDHEGTPYIVTSEWPAALSFRAWVAGAAVRPPAAPGERFTTVGAWKVPTQEFRGRVEIRTPPPPGSNEAVELESFTKLFGVPAPEQPPVPPAPDPIEPQPPHQPHVSRVPEGLS